MAVLSVLRQGSVCLLPPLSTRLALLSWGRGAVSRRGMGGGGPRIMPIRASEYQWRKFKDLLHLYTLIGVVPLGLLVFFVNIYIGPATLTEIPDDYRPKHWEYYKHPITRFFARHFFTSPQEDYEITLHCLYVNHQLSLMRRLEHDVRRLMMERGDYQGWYYKSYDMGKYYRLKREEGNDLKQIWGTFRGGD